MCSEGGCCGPCCSVRSWFATHVVFTMLGMFYLGAMTGVFALIPATVDLFDGLNQMLINANASSPLYNSTTFFNSDAELVSYSKIMMGVSAFGFVFSLIWTIVGFVVICGNNEKALIVYIVFCAVDMIIIIALLIVMATYSGKMNGTKSMLGNMFKPQAGLYINYAIHIALMDIAPMLCFFLCRPRVMSRFADPTKI